MVNYTVVPSQRVRSEACCQRCSVLSAVEPSCVLVTSATTKTADDFM